MLSSGEREGFRSEEGESPSVALGVVGGVVVPAAPEDASPGASEDADGVRVIAATSARLSIHVGGPGTGMAGVVGPGGEGLTQSLVAGEASGNTAVLAGGAGHGSDAGFGGELLEGIEAQAVIPELGEDLCCVDGAGARKGLEDGAVGMLLQVGVDEAAEVADLLDEGPEDGRECADELALGLAFQSLGLALGCSAQTSEQLGRGAASAVGVAFEEAVEALLAEVSGGLGRREVVEEGEGDGAVDVGEDGHGARPEAVQEAAELVGELNAGGDQIVAGAHGRAQGTRLVGRGAQGAEAVAVGAKDVGEDEGIAGIALALGRGVAGACGLEGVGMDGHDGKAGLDQRVDEQPRRTFDRDRELRTRAEAVERADQLRQSLCGVTDAEVKADLAGRIEDTEVVLVAGPVDAGEVMGSGYVHAAPPGQGGTHGSGVGRSHRSLIDRRSGLQAARAQHPVVGRGLPRRMEERVSQGPSCGKRRWLSPPGRRDLANEVTLTTSIMKVHQ